MLTTAAHTLTDLKRNSMCLEMLIFRFSSNVVYYMCFWTVYLQLQNENITNRKRTTDEPSPLPRIRGRVGLFVPRVELPSLGSAVLQHHGCQPLLDLLHRPVGGLRGCVKLRQKHRRVQVQFMEPPGRRVDSLFWLRYASVHHFVLRLVSRTGVSRWVGNSVLDLDGAAPPVLVQMVVMDESLQTVGSSFGFFLCVMKSFGVFRGTNTDVTWWKKEKEQMMVEWSL